MIGPTERKEFDEQQEHGGWEEGQSCTSKPEWEEEEEEEEGNWDRLSQKHAMQCNDRFALCIVRRNGLKIFYERTKIVYPKFAIDRGVALK